MYACSACKGAVKAASARKASEVGCVVRLFKHGINQIAIQVKHENIVVAARIELRALEDFVFGVGKLGLKGVR